MSVRLIYGKSGTGKSEYIFNEIKSLTNLAQKKYIITPEQFSYSSEKRLLDMPNTSSIINTEVISFNRIADRILVDVGGASKINLSDSRKSNVNV